jgi:penicillin amidase
MASRAARWAGLAVAGGCMAGCSAMAPLPKPTSLADRLAMFPTHSLPLEHRVNIYWNEHQIPFIEASSDDDAAFTLGLVHAHLRLGQMGLVRMLARGRLSEMVGPIGLDVDRGLRILSFSRAAAEIERGMDDRTRRWAQRFVDGINHYLVTTEELPHEFRVLGLSREPWTIADVLTIGRLAGTDINWLAWASLLPLRSRPDWPELWARLVQHGSASLPSFDGSPKTADLHEWLGGLGRTGSNSLALAPERTSTGGSILANDPHLGILVPNVWLIAGVKSPSYHVVGLMGPGLPIFAIGRNPHIAWGGTNMRAASSDLYDVSGLPESEISERRERIAVRWWFDEEITVRESPLGPIVSDVPFLAEYELPPAALRWTGHRVSDEIGSMLAVSRARGFAAFREAFEGFAVPGQNMLYADDSGNIGQVMAVQLPFRTAAPDDVILDRAAPGADWNAIQSAGDLPFSFNPESGYLASANNRPAAAGMPVGFFFSSDDRVQRMAQVVESEAPVDLETVMALQQDVRMASAAALRDLFVAGLDAAGLAEAATGNAAEAIRRMRDWDGHYRPDSVGAVSFEQFRDGFVRAFYPMAFGEEEGDALAAVGRMAALLPDDMAAAEPEVVQGALAAGLETVASGIHSYAGWADMHRLQLAHPLASAPIIGQRYRFAEHGVGGSSDTLMKTAHDASSERHQVRYGANARHVSDLTDPDANYFVLLGGQDGWLRSSTMLDQWPLWRDGAYVQIPLSLEAVRERFPHQLVLDH